MKRFFYFLIAIICISCSEQKETTFSLTGTSNDIENGTVLYLENSLTKEIIDSASVENNSFEFHTTLPNSPMATLLFTKDYSQYRFMWLETKPMTFDATTSDFRHANIQGSAPEKLSQEFYNSIDTFPRSERQKMEKEFVRDNPNSIVSAKKLSVYTTTWGRELTSELFNNFSDENKSSEYGKNISTYLEVNKNPKVGDKYVDFEMKDVDGNLRKVSDVLDKIVLLEFWSSNCRPCRKENPNLVKTYEKYNPLGFEIFAVSQDVKRTNWLKAIEKDGLPWIQVSDLKGHKDLASLIYGINGIPDNFLIDKDGTIIARNLRGEKLNEMLSEIIPVADNGI